MMNTEMLVLIKKHTDKVNEQTKSPPQETLEIKLNRQIETFCFSPTTNPSERGIWLLSEFF